ncbi:MAG: pseudouridine synthase [Acidiferrobacterales bacterium]
MKRIRLSKLLAARGVCSRREADVFIERGWVYVDGKQVTTLGTTVYPHQTVNLDKRARARQNQAVTILLNKPPGYVSTQPEKGYPPAASLISKRSRFTGDLSRRQFKLAHHKGLAAAGRLDIDSTGLLVLTQDGRIARQLVGASSAIEKEYIVRVEGRLTRQKLARLRNGLLLDGKALKPAQVSLTNDGRLRFALTEGRKRQIRRMCRQVGLEVVALKRVRIGKVRLRNLPIGQWRYLGENESFL